MLRGPRDQGKDQGDVWGSQEGTRGCSGVLGGDQGRGLGVWGCSGGKSGMFWGPRNAEGALGTVWGPGDTLGSWGLGVGGSGDAEEGTWGCREGGNWGYFGVPGRQEGTGVVGDTGDTGPGLSPTLVLHQHLLHRHRHHTPDPSRCRHRDPRGPPPCRKPGCRVPTPKTLGSPHTLGSPQGSFSPPPPPPAKDPACGDEGGTTLGVHQGEGMNWGRIRPGEGEGAGLGLNRVSGCRWGLRCAAAPLHPGPGDGDARVPPTPPWATSPSVARWWPLSPSTRRPTHGWRR